mmetsp:Transcript_10039/g.25054  ORF Transcript_10039/g.25054 Transcript_10039/m.25054 type:complete len:388 (+) Transcript_10039:1821-2984(+)
MVEASWVQRLPQRQQNERPAHVHGDEAKPQQSGKDRHVRPARGRPKQRVNRVGLFHEADLCRGVGGVQRFPQQRHLACARRDGVLLDNEVAARGTQGLPQSRVLGQENDGLGEMLRVTRPVKDPCLHVRDSVGGAPPVGSDGGLSTSHSLHHSQARGFDGRRRDEHIARRVVVGGGVIVLLSCQPNVRATLRPLHDAVLEVLLPCTHEHKSQGAHAELLLSQVERRHEVGDALVVVQAADIQQLCGTGQVSHFHRFGGGYGGVEHIRIDAKKLALGQIVDSITPHVAGGVLRVDNIEGVVAIDKAVQAPKPRDETRSSEKHKLVLPNLHCTGIVGMMNSNNGDFLEALDAISGWPKEAPEESLGGLNLDDVGLEVLNNFFDFMMAEG